MPLLQRADMTHPDRAIDMAPPRDQTPPDRRPPDADPADVAPPSPEICNGLDDDEDGAVDEAFAELGDVCEAGIGACAGAGTIACNPGGDGTICAVDRQPVDIIFGLFAPEEAGVDHLKALALVFDGG